MYQPNELKNVFTPGNDMSPTQTTLVKSSGSQIQEILAGLSGKVTPSFYETIERAAVHFQASIELGLHKGWKQNY